MARLVAGTSGRDRVRRILRRLLAKGVAFLSNLMGVRIPSGSLAFPPHPLRPKKQHSRPQPRPRHPKVPSAGPRTDWGGVAEWYDRLVGDEGSEYHREVVHPGVLRLFNVRPGEV